MTKPPTPAVRRFGQILGIDPDSIEEYTRYHAEIWPDLLEIMRGAHMKNYSIYLKDTLLFGYFEYDGDDFEKDMQAVAAHPRVQEWWKIMKPMQRPLATRAAGEWWADMREVFHMA